MPPRSAPSPRALLATRCAIKTRSSIRSYWRKPFFGGYKFEVSPRVSSLNGVIFFYFLATGVSPAMAEKMVGKGSQYPRRTRA